MRILVAPMMAMAQSSGPARRAQTLAAAMAARGWEATLCIPEGAPAEVPPGTRPEPVIVPTPLGLPRPLGSRMFPLAQRLGLNRHAPIASFDDVLRLTGNTDGRYLATAVGQLREVLRQGRFDAVYSEFSIPAVIAALAERIPVFGTASFPTQPSYACNPATGKDVNRVLRAASLKPVRSPEDLFTRMRVRFVPSCRALEPFPQGEPVVFTGPFCGFSAPEPPQRRNAVVAYLGNGTITPRRARAVLAEALRGSGLDLYVAGLPESRESGVRTAPAFDFSQLLPHAAVFVNHGGQNSLMDGIAYGTPQLLCPGKVFERRFNANAAARNGIGLTLEHDRFDAEEVRGAIGHLTENGEIFRKAAAALRHELAALGGGEAILDTMEETMATS